MLFCMNTFNMPFGIVGCADLLACLFKMQVFFHRSRVEKIRLRKPIEIKTLGVYFTSWSTSHLQFVIFYYSRQNFIILCQLLSDLNVRRVVALKKYVQRMVNFNCKDSFLEINYDKYGAVL